MKIVYYIIAMLMLAGCSPDGRERTGFTVMPEGLKDCKIYYISDGIAGITVVRCPNSSTTAYQGGKNSKTTVTVD